MVEDLIPWRHALHVFMPQPARNGGWSFPPKASAWPSRRDGPKSPFLFGLTMLSLETAGIDQTGIDQRAKPG